MTMIDLVLLTFTAGTFALGWWCRGRYGTVSIMVDCAKARIRSLFR